MTDADSAVVSGEIKMGADTVIIIESGICVATTTQPVITNAKFVSTVKNGSFTCSAKNLVAKTTYYARAYYKTGSRVTYGNEISFTSDTYPIELGNSFFQGQVLSLGTDLAGNVYAGGRFWHTADASDWSYVARWNGSTWNELTGMKSDDAVRSICADPQGNIFASIRRFPTVSEYGMQKWNGTAWSDAGVYNSSNFMITASCTDQAGNVYAIGTMKNSAGKYYVASWGTAGYRQLGNFNDLPLSICTDKNGNLYTAGLMNHGNGFGNFYIAKWDGNTWTETGNFSDVIFSICTDAAGNLLVAGAFKNASNLYYIGSWNGTTWTELGNINIPYNYYGDGLQKMCTGINGALYVAGDFKNAKGRYYIAKWDGNSWSELNSFNKPVLAMCADNKGNVYASSNATNSKGLWYVAKCN